MRGFKHGPNIDIIKIANRLCDRAEFEIERYCLAVGFRFDDLAAAYAGVATERFGSVLHSPRERSVRGQVQSMRVETAEVHQVELPALEGPRHSQDAGDALEAPAQVQGHRGEAVATKKRNPWEKFNTPEKRRKEALRRMSLRKDAMAQKMMGKKKPKEQTKRDKQLQDLYLARSKAKKLGLPIPPLPKHPLTPEEKRAKDRERHREYRAAVKTAAKKAVEAKGRHGGSKRRFTPEEQAAKMKVYHERERAKKKGLPPPPLPSEANTETEPATVQ